MKHLIIVKYIETTGAPRKRRFALTLAHTHGILSWLT